MAKLIDTHLHSWDVQKVHYSWLDGDTSILAQNYYPSGIEDQLQVANVSAAIMVQAANNLEDTAFMFDCAEQYPWIIGVVGWVDLLNTETAKQQLEAHLQNKYFKGIRHLIHDEPDYNWLLQPDVIESLRILASYGLPFDVVGVKIEHIRAAIEVAKQIPNLKLIFDHLNHPPIATHEQFGAWGDAIVEAASMPNFYAKISGLGTCCADFNNWSTSTIESYIAFVVQHFGTDKLMIGGDWPVSLLAGDYVTTHHKYQAVIESLVSEADREKIYSGNAIKFYNLISF
jgi:L-fuconolactonase